MNTTTPLKTDATPHSSNVLDQWRGFALVLVLIAHAFHASARVDGLGRVGVNIFFFISGILVFRSLARSRSTGWARVRSFWRHRWWRLFPAMFVYVLVMLIADYWLQNIPWLPPGCGFHPFLTHVPAALLYVIDYGPLPPPPLGHLWSTSVEMQFYFLAPLVFHWAGENQRRRHLIFGTLLFLLMALGTVQPWLGTKGKYEFQFAVWPMMLGFCCEFKLDWIKTAPARWRAIIGKLIMIVSIAGLAMVFWQPQMKTATIACGTLLTFVCLLAYAGDRPRASGLPGRALSWLGKRTYSIYLWQQPFTICYFLPVKYWPLGALLAVPVGAIWYHYFETPFLSAFRRQSVTSTELPARASV